MLGKQDILDSLESFDNALATVGQREKIRLEILGGAAIIVCYASKAYRGTSDIDSYNKIPKHIEDLAEAFSINCKCLAGYPVPKYELRLIKSDVKYKTLEVYYLSKIDIILMKLQRGDTKDYEDILVGGLLDLNDEQIELLLELGNELCNTWSSTYVSNWNSLKREIGYGYR